MNRLCIFIGVVTSCVAIGLAALGGPRPPEVVLSKFVPAGPLLYLEAKDLSSLLKDWNSSPEKTAWIQSDNYEVFSRSRLLARLKDSSDQFASAAGLPPKMDLFSQIAGERSVLAVYDIGRLQFLYVTYLPSARSMQTTLWQTRSNFEPRSSGGQAFYLRRDPDSRREVAFAVSGDYLLLATREDLMAEALQLMSGSQGPTVEGEPWWAQSTAAAGPSGDLRLVLNLRTLVPNGYFRTYWLQQNISDLSQYSAAVSDLFRSGTSYREERVLIRKKDAEHAPRIEGLDAVADLSRLVPDEAGIYEISANPAPDYCLSLLETKLLSPHRGPAAGSQFAPQLQLTRGEQGTAADLETRIDQAPVSPIVAHSESELKSALNQSSMLGALQVQATRKDQAGVLVRIQSAVILEADADWNESSIQSAIARFVKPDLTASDLGVGFRRKVGYSEFDGLWPLAIAVRGKYLLVADDSALMEAALANFNRKSEVKPAEFMASFNHERERSNFVSFVNLMDRPNITPGNGGERQPQFFSGNIASFSATFANVSTEHIEIRSDAQRVRQTVSYKWSR